MASGTFSVNSAWNVEKLCFIIYNLLYRGYLGTYRVSFGDTEDEVPNRYRDERKGE